MGHLPMPPHAVRIRARRKRAAVAPARCRRLFVEELEWRCLLAGDANWYDSPAPNWFQAAQTPSLMADTAVAAPSSRWIVRLDADFAAAVSDAAQSWQAFYPST